MEKLHDMIQIAMGWTNSHLHSFTIGDERYGMLYDEYPEGEIDEKTVKVGRAIGECRGLLYEYDFGDSWDHEIVVEESVKSARGLKHAVCLDGQHACPPEDCGGVYGYADLLQVLADPHHEEHESMLEWVGGPIDPTSFDVLRTKVEIDAQDLNAAIRGQLPDDRVGVHDGPAVDQDRVVSCADRSVAGERRTGWRTPR